ncbi:serine/threonine-protein kinase [Nocardia amikacinitolerans]|uniref:serine/threonine-protein kinase n=1 Tax=Nocardia amikacinitolerans TaxID=756689 RepID=UPI0020A4C5EA|nr:serine/threonine-protein kinase [Nocardia amikacinitolerans]MCP2274863.1 serine/threonine protein kinase [Nocardia amikacinitolerans]
MLASGEVFAGYVIERQLGRGGMGSVYLAKHPRLPRMTALKLLNRELFFDKEVRARFEREADLVARLDHPGIVTVYDRGLEDDQLWISMQYIDGIDAASVDPKTLPPERAVQIIKETADALDYAHGMGVLHRDVKPANILLARSTGGRGERVYLTDFGIARLRDDTGHLTQTGTFTATLAYASPEQLTGASLDHRSDQYSLACALFWLFTGSGPFAATNPAQVIQGHLQSAPPALSSVRPGLPFALDGVLAKAMAKRPDDRFASCSEFAAAAQAALSGQSVPSMPLVGGPRPVTAPPQPISGPHPITGGPIPVTGGQYPVGPTTSGSQPLTGQPMTTPQGAMPTATGPHQQTGPSGQYPQQPGFGFAPPPGPQMGGGHPMGGGHQPPRKSNTGLIAALAVGVVVLIAVVVGIVVAVSGGSSSGSGGTTTTAPVTTTKRPVTADAAAISNEFPGMVPADKDGDTGYNGATCGSYSPDRPSVPTDGTPDFGNWAYQWDCFGGGNNDDPFFTIYVYKTAADAQAALNNLPSDATKSTDSNGGKSYTNYKFENSGPKMVTVFTGDPDRGQFLMYTDGIVGTIDEVLRWWRSAPLN